MAVDGGLAVVLAAVITGVFAIVKLLLGLRAENRTDHATVVKSLDRLADGIERVEDKIDSHIVDHSRGLM